MDFPVLKKTPLYEIFSDVGKRIYQPNGIFYWANRAKKECEFNATIGSAFGSETDILPEGRKSKIVYYLPGLKKYINLEPEKMAAYAPVPGVPTFRDVWTKWILKKGKNAKNMPSPPRKIDHLISKPVICNGITNAIFITNRLFLNPGESIVCPNKRWGNYNSVLKLQNEETILPFQFFKEGSFNLAGMLDAMEKSLQTQDKIVLILNFPNNPTGYCPSTKEAGEIVDSLIEFCKTHQKPVIVLCDDAYEGFVYNSEVVSHSLFYELIDRHSLLIPIKMDGTSKEMLMYGGRIAAITLGLSSQWVSDEDIPILKAEWDNKIQGMVRSTISNSNHLAQEILVEYLNDDFTTLLNDQKIVQEILQKRYDETIGAFHKYPHPLITMDPASGGFFVFLNIEGISATKFADHLVTKYRVGTFPSENEEENINGIRFAFCSVPAKDIDECFKRIQQAMNDFPV